LKTSGTTLSIVCSGFIAGKPAPTKAAPVAGTVEYL